MGPFWGSAFADSADLTSLTVFGISVSASERWNFHNWGGGAGMTGC
jgi:hypothetical protein